MSVIDIIVPTFNNPQYLYPCVNSIVKHTAPEDLAHLYIVNNGTSESVEPLTKNPYMTVLQQEKNLGWEGGLKAGLAASKAPYVVFMNDDTFIPYNQRLWLDRMICHMGNPDVAAVGPTSNVVMGKQQMFLPTYESYIRSKFLIGFCMLVKRSYLDQAGGVDDTLQGGDDLDLSIRLRKLGKHLIIDREVFVYHHGFKTGERVEGSPQVGGWNSLQKIERTNFGLINKHGLPAFLDLWAEEPSPSSMLSQNWGDNENKLVKEWTVGEKIAELGCGDKKLFDHSVGFDLVSKGEEIQALSKGRKSLADVAANLEHELPAPPETFDTIIAQHILEHICDTVSAINAWKKALKHGGRMIIAVPDQTIRNTIPMNWEHVRAFTPESLKNQMESLGMKTVDMLNPNNGVSLIGIFSKNGS